MATTKGRISAEKSTMARTQCPSAITALRTIRTTSRICCKHLCRRQSAARQMRSTRRKTRLRTISTSPSRGETHSTSATTSARRSAETPCRSTGPIRDTNCDTKIRRRAALRMPHLHFHEVLTLIVCLFTF